MAEAVKRPVSPARKDITADELKEEGSRTIATADNLSMFGKAKLWLAGVTGGGAIIDWISDGHDGRQLSSCASSRAIVSACAAA